MGCLGGAWGGLGAPWECLVGHLGVLWGALGCLGGVLGQQHQQQHQQQQQHQRSCSGFSEDIPINIVFSVLFSDKGHTKSTTSFAWPLGKSMLDIEAFLCGKNVSMTMMLMATGMVDKQTFGYSSFSSAQAFRRESFSADPPRRRNPHCSKLQ